MRNFFDTIARVFKQSEPGRLGNFKFLSPDAHKLFAQNGFVKLQMFNAQSLKAIEEIFTKYIEIDNIEGVYDSMANESPETNTRIHKALEDILKTAFQQHFENYQLVCSVFFVKNKSEASKVSIHIDPSLTSSDFNHFGIWIPLVPIDKKMGGFYLLKNSQKLLPRYYHPGMPAPFLDISPSVEPLMEEVLFKAGEVLIFDNSIAHYTGPNVSKRPRIALIVKMIDANAPLITVNYSGDHKNTSVYLHRENVLLNGKFAQNIIPESSKKLARLKVKTRTFTKEDLPKIIKTCSSD